MTASREDRAAWRAARTFEELCELAARFVEGRTSFFPGWLASTTDEESDAIAVDLAALNRRGFLTVASQPAAAPHEGHDGQVWKRRAFVLGFCRPALAKEVERACAPLGLATAAFPPASEDAGTPEPVGLRGDDAYLFAGVSAREEELELFAPWISDAALADLAGTCYVSVHDPVWGRADVLWRAFSTLRSDPTDS